MSFYPNTAIASGGYTPSKLISAASTNATSLTTQATTLGFVAATNVNAAPRYLKFYDKASAPTVGTDIPILTFLIPGNTAGAGTNPGLSEAGILFQNGVAFAITGAAADGDTTAIGAGDVVLNLGYK